jgi:hypothetical protein
MHRGRLHPVPGDADRGDEPFLTSADRTLERSAGRRPPVEIVEGPDGVELDQVNSRYLQPFDRATDAVVRLGCRWVPSLGREEDPIADPRHPRSEPQLRVAVVRRRVEVIDARMQRELDRPIGDILRDLGEGCPAIDQHAAHVAEAPESPLLHRR